MTELKIKILFPAGKRKVGETYLQQLMREFDTSYHTVRNALAGETNSEFAKKIRMRAIEIGGEMYATSTKVGRTTNRLLKH